MLFTEFYMFFSQSVVLITSLEIPKKLNPFFQYDMIGFCFVFYNSSLKIEASSGIASLKT